jgi:purine-binding chemotaxis protein CheW
MDIAKIRKKLIQKREGQKANNLKPEEKEPAIIEDSNTANKVEPKVSEEKSPEQHLIDEKRHETQTVEKKIEVEQEKKDDVIEILTFSLLKEEFAFKISQLDEIIRPQTITKVPKVPLYVIGITSLRGKIIPVIDLKVKLSLTEKSSDINSKGKILIIKGPKGPIGAMIDKVIGVIRISKSEILPPPSHLTETELKFVEGIAIVDKRFISIINMEEAIEINLK